MKISDLFLFNAALFMFDYINDNLPISFRNTFQHNRDVKQRTTRQSNDIHVPRTETKFASVQPVYNFPKIWNTYSNLEMSSRNRFKNSLRFEFLSNYSDIGTCQNMYCRDCHRVWNSISCHTIYVPVIPPIQHRSGRSPSSRHRHGVWELLFPSPSSTPTLSTTFTTTTTTNIVQ